MKTVDAPHGRNTMSEPKTQTLDVPGAVLHYDIRDADGGSGEPNS